MNSTKKYNEAINNSKNKLNSKINWLFKLEPNTHLMIPKIYDTERLGS